MEIMEAFGKMVDVAITARDLDNAMQSAGFDETPYTEIYGGIADAIYSLLGEKTDTFEESVTYDVLSSKKYSREIRGV